MLKLRESFYSPIESDLRMFLWRQFYVPMLSILETSKQPRINSSISYLLGALRDGRIQYANGQFSGQFNARISRELSAFAAFDKRSKTWHGDPPPAIKAAAILSNGKRQELQGRLQSALDEAEATIDSAIKTLSFGEDLPIFAMGEDIAKDLYLVGVMPELDERTIRKLRIDYTDSQKLNIKNWSPDQIQRLREMVGRIQTSGDNESIKALIQSEWNTSAAKAKFLARQETSLFFSKLSLDRASRAGVRKYKWSTSHDERVRVSHKHLDGKIISLDDPPIVDPKTGRRAHAGEDFGCRCAKIWILD